MHLRVIFYWLGEISLFRDPRFVQRLAECFFPIPPKHGCIRRRTLGLTLHLRFLESRQDLPCQPPREFMELGDVDVDHISYIQPACALPRATSSPHPSPNLKSLKCETH